MKGIKLITLAIFLFMAGVVHAETPAKEVTKTKKMRPPAWGPAGYPDVRYYYLPDVWTYYDVKTKMFIYYYYKGKVWVHHHYLPRRYRHYDLFAGYKVPMVDYKGNTPYKDYMKHKAMYARGYHGSGVQKTVGTKPVNYHKKGKKAIIKKPVSPSPAIVK